jgi:hypothetical protein
LIIDGCKLLAGFGDEYFNIPEEGPSMDDKSFLQGYKSILTSKDSEETMVSIKFSSSSKVLIKFIYSYQLKL